jgi:hypothetical protein
MILSNIGRQKERKTLWEIEKERLWERRRGWRDFVHRPI